MSTATSQAPAVDGLYEEILTAHRIPLLEANVRALEEQLTAEARRSASLFREMSIWRESLNLLMASYDELDDREWEVVVDGLILRPSLDDVMDGLVVHEEMTGNHYQQMASRTYPQGKEPGYMLTNGGLGIAGESGEVADLIKKTIFHGHDLDIEGPKGLKKELGDVQWYIAMIASAAGLTLSEIMAANIHKLQLRYPDGFSSEASINRQEAA